MTFARWDYTDGADTELSPSTESLRKLLIREKARVAKYALLVSPIREVNQDIGQLGWLSIVSITDAYVEFEIEDKGTEYSEKLFRRCMYIAYLPLKAIILFREKEAVGLNYFFPDFLALSEDI